MNTFTYESKYGNYEDCSFRVGHYENGNTAVEVWSNTEGPITKITVNPDITIPKNMLAIKNYSENEGVDDWMISQNLIEAAPLHIIKIGWVEIPVYRLTKYGKEVLSIVG